MRVAKERGWLLVLWRELKRMTTRPVYLFILVVLPLGFLAYFATLMPDGLPQSLPIGVIDHDGTSLSRNIVRQLESSPQTKVVAHYPTFSEANNALQDGSIIGFVELPDRLYADVLNGQQPTIPFYYDQTNLLTGSLVQKDLTVIMKTVSAGTNLSVRRAKGQPTAVSMAQIQPIVAEVRSLGNPWINYSVYLLSVILPGMLQLMILLTTVYVIGIELKKNSSYKWYRLAGSSLFRAIFGKLLPYTFGFIAMGTLYLVVLFKGLHYPLNAPFGWMWLDMTLLVLTAQAFGIFMIGIFPVLRDGLSFSGLFGVLSMSYSGLSFPIEGMPALLQGLSWVFPLRWYFLIYQSVALNGFNPLYYVQNYGIMLLFMCLPLLVAKRLRKAVIEMNYPKK